MVDGRTLELPGEGRKVWNSLVGEMVVESEVPGMRIAGRDLLRDGGATEGTRGGETREGDEGAVSIGGSAGVTAGAGAGAGVGTCESSNPGGSAGSGKSDAAPPLASAFAAPTGGSATTSETGEGAGGLRPNEARSRSTA